MPKLAAVVQRRREAPRGAKTLRAAGYGTFTVTPAGHRQWPAWWLLADAEAIGRDVAVCLVMTSAPPALALDPMPCLAGPRR
jgi:hypothetical protein